MQELGKPTGDIVPPRKPLDASCVDPSVREALGIGEEYREPLPIGKLLGAKCEVKTCMPTTNPSGCTTVTPTTAPAKSGR